MLAIEKLPKEKQGEVFILAKAFLGGIAPIIMILSFRGVPPLLSLAWSMLFSAFFFALIITFRNGWDELWKKEASRDILLATITNGIIFHLLYFIGLNYTTAGNASIIALTEIFFSFLLFNVWHKEYFSPTHIIGTLLIFIGALIVLFPNIHGLRIGDLLMLLAFFVAPFGNFFQRRARIHVKSEMIFFIRSVLTAPVVFALAYGMHVDFTILDIRQSFFLLLIIGFFFLGLSKLLWMESIHRINVAKAKALDSIAPLLTLFFAWMILGDIPTTYQLLACIPIFFGVLLLGKNRKVLSN